MLEYVLCEEEEEEEEEGAEMEAQAERLNDRRVLLAGFLKLAMFSVIDMKMAAPVFAQYLKVSSHSLLCAHLDCSSMMKGVYINISLV